MTHPSLDTILSRIDDLLARKDRVTVAIDGSCASGKTTLAALLAANRDCNVFHMDDFFLRPQQRTAQRFAQPGGNVDYERFREEVLLPLQSGHPFSYRPFDCSTFTLAESRQVEPRKITIVEGTYSLHPYFADPYDLRIFLSASPALQRQRILERPAFVHQRFFEEWIPMENRYFSGLSVAENCDMVFYSDV